MYHYWSQNRYWVLNSCACILFISFMLFYHNIHQNIHVYFDLLFSFGAEDWTGGRDKQIVGWSSYPQDSGLIIIRIITSAEEGGYVFGAVCLSLCLSLCLFVCLSVCPSDYSQTCERILTKFLVGVGHGPRTKWYNFGGDPDHASDPGVQSPKSGSSGLLKKLQTDLCHAVFGGGLFSLSASSYSSFTHCTQLLYDLPLA